MNNSISKVLIIIVVFLLLSGMLLADKDKAIILEEKISYHIKNIDNAKLKVYKKIKILNKNGEGYSTIVIGENNYVKLKKVKGEVTDSNGKRLKKFDEDDFKKTNLSNINILMPEAWNKYFEYKHPSYPYIIEFEYEVEHKSLLYSRGWFPQYNVPVNKSEYNLIIENNFPFKTHSINIDVEPSVKKDGNKTIYTWQLFDIEERDLEDYMPKENKIQKALYFIPMKYKIKNYQGSYDSWKGYADFCRILYKDRYNLDQKTKNKIIELVKGVDNKREKINILYKYLQDHTRYQAIFLGIGGMQPHFAQDIYNNCYGDCKDLSTLMIAMLNVVGIKANPVFIRVRDDGVVDKDIIVDQFNHVMAMVPLENDTLWLENTADYRIAGDLSYNDEGCNVLIVFDDGYKFIKTPESKYSDNKWITKFNGTLNAHGFLNFNGEMILSGNFAHDKRYDFINSKKDELKEWLLKELGRFVPETYVDEFEFLNINENFDKPVVIKFKGIYSKFGNKSGKRVFVNPNIFNRYEPDNIPEETVEERDFPLYTNFAVNVIDSINITFPSYYKVEAVPANADFTYDFAKYNSNYEIKDAQLAYIRSYERYKKIIPVENYAERVKMLKKMVKADKAKVVFKKLK